MNTQTFIINDIKPLEISSEINEVQEIFSNLAYSHLPVSKEGIFEGCISETDSYCFDAEKTLEEYKYALEPFFVRKKTHYLDILEAFALAGSNIMPALDENNKYLGYFELNDIMGLFHDTPFLNETGGIIVVEKGTRDFSFSEVAQIVESNEAKIFGAYISKLENDVTQATIKIGHSGMNAIVQTFRRYSYNVVSNHEEDKFLEDLKERSDYLDKYLNM